ncbi:nodulation protein NfeD [Candidatus Bipolaricaulota bacterium]|nr:nodulation protein NfeD [Candidatus Bipolaricaulota bacterium]
MGRKMLALLAGLGLALLGMGGEIWLLTVEGEIGRGMVSYLQKGLSEAAKAGATAVILEFSTPGGYLDAAQACRDLILGAKVRTIAYVNREAYSAGALLAIACEEIYFAPGGVMGAATPVYFDPQGRMEQAPEKIVSAVRALFRATAETRGRDPRVAEAMVDPYVEIPGLIERGKLLTLTAKTAAEWGYSEGEAGTLAEVLALAGLAGAVVRAFDYRWTDWLVNALTNPWVASLLIAVGALGLLIEMFTPGFGVPGTLGLASLALFFWSHYLAGLAGWESFVFFLAGIIAIFLEVFVFTATDFGLAGIVGLILIGLGFYTAMTGPLTHPDEALRAIGAVALALVVSLLGFAAFLTWVPKSRLRLGGVVLKSAIEERAVGRPAPASSPYVGKRGNTLTDLHPVGKAEFEGEQLDVVAEEGFIPKGSVVEIVRDEGYRKVVRQVKEG